MNYSFINTCVDKALKALKYKRPESYVVEPTKKISFGDFATNVAMVLAKTLKQNPQVIAQKIADNIAKNNKTLFQKVEVAPPGFINFWLKPTQYKKAIDPFLKSKYAPALLPQKELKNINMEYVSANPTGALHLGHVRNAYVGDVLIRILRSIGHKVTSEYWINDMGTQVDLFELSVLCRYLELFGKKVKFPEDGYKGEDPKIVAQLMKDKFGDKFVNVAFNDKIIADKKAKKEIWKFSINSMLEQIKKHLALIGVKISVWTSETKVYNSDIIDYLMQNGLKKHSYKKDGALWLKTTDGGQDDKDRVLVKSDGSRTYFLTDIANQYNKKRRKFDLFLHVWGSDHEGHVKRMKLAMPVIGCSSDDLEVVLIQMVKLEKNGQEVKLSKRSGTSITIPDMLEMMNVDTSRWYILAQATKTQIVIDLEKVSKLDNSNPVYYIQYAHARICQMLKKVKLKDKKLPTTFNQLTSDAERSLINMLLSLDMIVYSAAKSYEPHRLSTYVHELAKAFHSWYNETNIKNTKDAELQKQRYYLAKAVKQAIAFVLGLLGISAPDRMQQLS